MTDLTDTSKNLSNVCATSILTLSQIFKSHELLSLVDHGTNYRPFWLQEIERNLSSVSIIAQIERIVSNCIRNGEQPVLATAFHGFGHSITAPVVLTSAFSVKARIIFFTHKHRHDANFAGLVRDRIPVDYIQFSQKSFDFAKPLTNLIPLLATQFIKVYLKTAGKQYSVQAVSRCLLEYWYDLLIPDGMEIPSWNSHYRYRRSVAEEAYYSYEYFRSNDLLASSNSQLLNALQILKDDLDIHDNSILLYLRDKDCDGRSCPSPDYARKVIDYLSVRSSVFIVGDYGSDKLPRSATCLTRDMLADGLFYYLPALFNFNIEIGMGGYSWLFPAYHKPYLSIGQPWGVLPPWCLSLPVDLVCEGSRNNSLALMRELSMRYGPGLVNQTSSSASFQFPSDSRIFAAIDQYLSLSIIDRQSLNQTPIILYSKYTADDDQLRSRLANSWFMRD